jgi:hypothetical protein
MEKRSNKTPKAGSGTGQILAKVTTVSEYVSNFEKELEPTQRKAVSQAVTFISGIQQQMVSNALKIGERLNTLRSEIGEAHFSDFMSKVLPRLGISRSTGYRWAASAGMLEAHVPDSSVRLSLMASTNGQGIIIQEQGKNGKPGKWILAPAYQTAFKKAGPAPKDSDATKIEQYVATVQAEAKKFRTNARTKGSAEGKDRARLVQYFQNFLKKYGSKATEDLLGKFDDALTAHVKALDSRKSAEETVNRGTGSKAVAHKTGQAA